MNSVFLLIAVLFPIAGSVLIPLLPFQKKAHWQIYTEIITLITSALALFVVVNRPDELVLFTVSDTVRIALQVDGLGMVFAGLISILWPIAVLYSFEYMNHEERQRYFFMFYIMTFGITLGIAFSANILTMYFFYEMLTLVTVPLVIHTFTRDAVLATRKYIYYSLGGAALGFMAVVFLIRYCGGSNFVPGGFLTAGALENGLNFALTIYVLAFMGFSIKAAMFPFHGWLPDAGVAPTPVTALLHAVAVVKAGAFAVIRLTYYCFGTELLRGTWAQNLVMGLAMFTIVFGCSMAVKETHLKRRLAYSTVSNLSYICFGVTIMTPAGLLGALCHMCFHAIMKISAFFCAGAIMHQTDKDYVHETNGFAKKMPWVYLAFTVSALGMMGVPGGCGFISKWYLAQAALLSGNHLAWLGVGALLVSALLTAIYMMTMIIRGYYTEKDFDESTLENVKDPSWKMILPLMLFSIGIVAFGLYSAPLVEFLTKVADGLI